MFFIERESAFFLRLEGGHFIKFLQHGVRLGLAAWILKTCFQADRSSSLTSGGAMTKRSFDYIFQANSTCETCINLHFFSLFLH